MLAYAGALEARQIPASGGRHLPELGVLIELGEPLQVQAVDEDSALVHARRGGGERAFLSSIERTALQMPMVRFARAPGHPRFLLHPARSLVRRGAAPHHAGKRPEAPARFRSSMAHI